jgi:hypothetical protein
LFEFPLNIQTIKGIGQELFKLNSSSRKKWFLSVYLW